MNTVSLKCYIDRWLNLTYMIRHNTILAIVYQITTIHDMGEEHLNPSNLRTG